MATGWAGLVLVAGVVLAGCGGPPTSGGGGSGTPASSGAGPSAADVIPVGDIPDSQVYVPFSSPNGGFTVSVPQGWARSAAGTATTFADKYNSVRIDQTPRAAAPDVASVRAQDVPQLQKSVSGFALGDVQSASRTAGTAVVVTYEANSAPDAVTGKSVREAVERYSFWHSGQEVVLTLSGPKGSDNVDPWRKITDSLRWQA